MPQRFQAEKAALTQWAPIWVEHPLMTKNTGLREEKCLGELPEDFSTSHTDYNVSGQEIYETAGRRPEIPNPKFPIPNKIQYLKFQFRNGNMGNFPHSHPAKARKHDGTKARARPKGALLPIGFSLCLTAQTKRRPGYGLQPFLFNRLPAIHALAKVPFIEPT